MDKAPPRDLSVERFLLLPGERPDIVSSCRVPVKLNLKLIVALIWIVDESILAILRLVLRVERGHLVEEILGFLAEGVRIVGRKHFREVREVGL